MHPRIAGGLGHRLGMGVGRYGGSTSILGLSGVSYWLAGTRTDSQHLSQLGNSGAGDSQYGSTSGSDSNDPTTLDWIATDDYDVTVDGVNYKYLSDNLVTNGTFDTDTGWTKGTGWTISGGTANCDGTQPGTSQTYRDNSGIVVGAIHEVTFTVSNYSAGIFTLITGGSSATTARTANGTYTEYVKVLGNQRVYLSANADFIGSVDNVSVRLLAVAAGDYLYLPGTSGNYASSPDSAATSVTGDITLTVQCALTTIGSQSLLSKYATVGTYAWLIRISGGGNIEAYISDDGTTSTSRSFGAYPFSANEIGYIQFRYVASTHTGSLYYSSTGSSWTQIGSDYTGYTQTSIFDSGAKINIGCYNDSTNDRATGKFYYASIHDNATGTGDPVWEFDASLSTQSGYTDSYSGDAITINRSSTGLKSTLVTRPESGTASDDYFEVSDHNDLDVGSGIDFSATVQARVFGTPAASQVLIAKKADLTTGAGYAIYLDTSRRPVGVVGDGSASKTITGTALSEGKASQITFQRNGANLELIQIDEAGTTVATPVADTTADLTNSNVLRVARLSGAGTSYLDGNPGGWVVMSGRALTTTQAESLYAEINTLRGGRIGE